MPGPALPEPVRVELDRIGARWSALPLEGALARGPAVRAVAQSLAGAPLPDLGPAVLVDQLRVVAYDAACAGDDVAPLLQDLRRSL